MSVSGKRSKGRKTTQRVLAHMAVWPWGNTGCVLSDCGAAFQCVHWQTDRPHPVLYVRSCTASEWHAMHEWPIRLPGPLPFSYSDCPKPWIHSDMSALKSGLPDQSELYTYWHVHVSFVSFVPRENTWICLVGSDAIDLKERMFSN